MAQDQADAAAVDKVLRRAVCTAGEYDITSRARIASVFVQLSTPNHFLARPTGRPTMTRGTSPITAMDAEGEESGGRGVGDAYADDDRDDGGGGGGAGGADWSDGDEGGGTGGYGDDTVTNTCNTEGCSGISYCRGMCGKHYHNWRRVLRAKKGKRFK